MKKFAALLLAMGLFLGFLPSHQADAAVTWGPMELKKGQIGRVTILKDTKIYTQSGTKYNSAGTAKKGQLLRVYTNRNGYLGIGGGKFVKLDKSVKYETPSKEKYQAANGVKVVKRVFPDSGITYPQVTGMVSKAAEQEINSILYSIAEESAAYEDNQAEDEEEARMEWDDSWGEFWDWEFKSTFSVHFNSENKLSIVYVDYAYTGGVHGNSGLYSVNFDCNTGNTFDLSHVIKGKNLKVRDYAWKDLKNQEKKGKTMLLAESADEVIINDDERPWVFNSKGIKIFFQEYEISPYAAGHPEVVVPYSVYK